MTPPADDENESDKARNEAVKAVADTASKALDTVNSVGAFLNRVFGNIVEDTVGLAGDPLRAYRLRRLADLQQKTDAYLATKGVNTTEPISPRIAYRIVEEASLEDDEDIHSRFARLLAEALDPNGEKITRRHAEVIASLTSENFVALDYCWKFRDQLGHVMARSRNIQYEPRSGASRSTHELEIAVGVTEDGVRNLANLGLIRPIGDEFMVFPSTRRSMGEVRMNESFESVIIYSDIYRFELTEFGTSFCRAVIEPPKPQVRISRA
jgi:hypothetical protein